MNDVINALQKTIKSQRNIDDLILTFMTEERCNQKEVKVLTLHNIKKKLNDQKWSDKDLQQQHNELKSKQTSNKAKKKDQKVLTLIRINSNLMMICKRNMSLYNLHKRFKKKVLID